METEAIRDMVIRALEDVKAKEIKVLDVRGKSSITDIMIIASGTSSRHLKSLAVNVAVEAKKHNVTPLGTEGENGGEWVLVDLGDVVVHIMLPAIRDFYNLEKLWMADEPDSDQEQQA